MEATGSAIRLVRVMSARPDQAPAPSPGRGPDALLRTGVIVTGIGLVCTLIALAPLVVPGIELPSLWWFLSMLTGVGLALVILGLLRSSRSRRRSARSQP